MSLLHTLLGFLRLTIQSRALPFSSLDFINGTHSVKPLISENYVGAAASGALNPRKSTQPKQRASALKALAEAKCRPTLIFFVSRAPGGATDQTLKMN
jgi:hypothetical protein